MFTQASLVSEIDAFLTESQMTKTAFGLKALNDGTFVARLKRGDNVTLKTVDRVRAYIAAERAKMQPQPSKRRRAA